MPPFMGYIALHLSVHRSVHHIQPCLINNYNLVRPSLLKLHTDIGHRCSLRFWGQSNKSQGHSDCDKAALVGHVLFYKQTLVTIFVIVICELFQFETIRKLSSDNDQVSVCRDLHRAYELQSNLC